MSKVIREHKDTVFRMLFRDPARFCELYRAIGGVIHDESSVVEVTLRDVFHMNMRNDISYEVDNNLVVFVEHQSTVCGNMPIRMLEYALKTFRAQTDSRLLYSPYAQKLKSVEFYVVYHGQDDSPEVFSLSDHMTEIRNARNGRPFLDCNIDVIDIRLSMGDSVLLRSRSLHGYSLLQAYVLEKLQSGADLEEAVEAAVKRCLYEGVLVEFLSKHALEVKDIMYTQYDYETDIRVKCEESMKRGIEVGREEGREEGIEVERLSIARKMLLQGFDSMSVSQVTGLELERVLSLGSS